MADVKSSLFPDAHRKLVAGTEVLRTGGGTTTWHHWKMRKST